MKRVLIFTNFAQYLKSYSPLIIVTEQIEMLTNAGYEPVVVVSEGFEAPEDSIFNKATLARIPNVSVSNTAAQDISFEADIDFLTHSLQGIFKEHKPEVVITHDMIFLPDYVKHRLAAFNIVKDFPEVRWLHWVHSATSPGSLINERKQFEDKYKELLGEKFPNSFVVFPNSGDIPRVAKNFGYMEDEVVEVPHSTNYIEFNDFHPIVKRLIKEKDLLDDDVIMVYPLRLDRGKQPHFLIDLVYALKSINLKAKVIFADFHSTGGDKVDYRNQMKADAEKMGVSENVIFMSEFDASLEMESPRKVVSDLFTLSNFFMLPSQSETYSLIAQEAMMKGNFCILNQDFQPMRSVYGDKAIYKPFSANIAYDGSDGEINTEYSDQAGFFKDIAIYINYVLKNNKVVKGSTWVRKERNPDAIFKNYLEPLLHGGDE